MTRLLLFSALVLAANSVCPVRSEAQAQRGVQLNEGRSVDDVKVGARLRVLLQGDDPADRVRGLLKGFGATTMILEVDGSSRELPMSSIIVLEERYRDRKRAAIAGALVAAVAVYAWDFFGSHPRYLDQGKRYKENAVALGVAAPVSALIGAAIGWPRWRGINMR
jgi:hypothetical protein